LDRAASDAYSVGMTQANTPQALEIGRILKLKLEWCEKPAEAEMPYEVLEDRGNRVLVRALNTMHLQPTYVYLKSMFVL
jgi:hypothetical protein